MLCIASYGWIFWALHTFVTVSIQVMMSKAKNVPAGIVSTSKSRANPVKKIVPSKSAAAPVSAEPPPVSIDEPEEVVETEVNVEHEQIDTVEVASTELSVMDETPEVQEVLLPSPVVLQPANDAIEADDTEPVSQMEVTEETVALLFLSMMYIAADICSKWNDKIMLHYRVIQA